MSQDFPAPLLFFRSLLSDPLKIGALAPSSPRLSRLMASRVDPAQSSVLEIGAGTGAITRALLHTGLCPERLFVIERDPELAAFLRVRFPYVKVHCGEAIHAARILSVESVERVETIVSSLPLRNLPQCDQLELVRAMISALSHRGQIIQFTYGAGCPIPYRRLGLDAERLGRVWMNFPPATVWRFTKSILSPRETRRTPTLYATADCVCPD
jgi:phosphatidylethanolamine/phosphatidyl-N-methylethanolamine N-methyltransferase